MVILALPLAGIVKGTVCVAENAAFENRNVSIVTGVWLRFEMVIFESAGPQTAPKSSAAGATTMPETTPAPRSFTNTGFSFGSLLKIDSVPSKRPTAVGMKATVTELSLLQSKANALARLL